MFTFPLLGLGVPGWRPKRVGCRVLFLVVQIAHFRNLGSNWMHDKRPFSEGSVALGNVPADEALKKS